MASITTNLKRIGLSFMMSAVMLLALVDLAAAAAPSHDTIPPDPLRDVSTQVITLPTPFPTPGTVTYTQELETAFWDVTNYEGAVSAIQTFFLLQGIQDIVVIFAWLGLLAISFAFVKGIITGVNSKRPAEGEDSV